MLGNKITELDNVQAKNYPQGEIRIYSSKTNPRNYMNNHEDKYSDYFWARLLSTHGASDCTADMIKAFKSGAEIDPAMHVKAYCIVNFLDRLETILGYDLQPGFIPLWLMKKNEALGNKSPFELLADSEFRKLDNMLDEIS